MFRYIRIVSLSILWTVLSSILSGAQTYNTLVIFDGTNGATPVTAPLVQGTDGNLYGTTLGGGTNELGTVFRMSPTGKLTTIYSFCAQPNCLDGYGPYGGLVLGSNGNFYGTTFSGGADGISGTIFEITSSGMLTTLHNFENSDGASPVAPMIEGRDGNFYGIASSGGSLGAGTIFKITPKGTLSTLYNLGAESSDATGPLMQASDGNFYGTTELGGANGYGSIFKISPNGVFSTFYSFNSTDGSAPACGLIQASDGYLYGTTYQGGSNDNDDGNGNGTVFKISLSGALTTLHNFDQTDGSQPIAGLIQATDGNFYGTTYGGGTAGGWGTVFEITPAGTLTNLHNFDGDDGAQSYAPVSQDTNGNFYGVTSDGTGAPNGTVFGFSKHLGSFVSFIRNSGKIGQSVAILGEGLESTTDVSFNQTPTTFNVRSNSLLIATVPAGATSGVVTVTTSSGTMLKSNVPYRVIQ